jgi:hypothetical protein
MTSLQGSRTLINRPRIREYAAYCTHGLVTAAGAFELTSCRTT